MVLTSHQLPAANANSPAITHGPSSFDDPNPDLHTLIRSLHNRVDTESLVDRPPSHHPRMLSDEQGQHNSTASTSTSTSTTTNIYHNKGTRDAPPKASTPTLSDAGFRLFGRHEFSLSDGCCRTNLVATTYAAICMCLRNRTFLLVQGTPPRHMVGGDQADESGQLGTTPPDTYTNERRREKKTRDDRAREEMAKNGYLGANLLEYLFSVLDSIGRKTVERSGEGACQKCRSGKRGLAGQDWAGLGDHEQGFHPSPTGQRTHATPKPHLTHRLLIRTFCGRHTKLVERRGEGGETQQSPMVGMAAV